MHVKNTIVTQPNKCQNCACVRFSHSYNKHVLFNYWVPDSGVSITYTKKNYRLGAKGYMLTWFRPYSWKWCICKLDDRNLSGIILRLHPHSAEEIMWPISDICQGHKNGQEREGGTWDGKYVKNTCHLWFEQRVWCFVQVSCEQSLSNTLKVYSIVNLHVQINVYIIS